MINDYQRLIKNLIATALIVIAVIVVYIYFSTNQEHRIDDTPIRVETVKNIAEISSISYTDEVVVDSVEYYELEGTLDEILDWPKVVSEHYSDQIRERLTLKRRLTLIIKGEVKYGLDLLDKSFSIKQDSDTLWLHLPQAKVLDIVLSPSQTEVFHEQGEWSDAERKQMEEFAKEQLRKNAEKLNLKSKAEDNVTQLFSKLIRTKKKLIIVFEEN